MGVTDKVRDGRSKASWIGGTVNTNKLKNALAAGLFSVCGMAYASLSAMGSALVYDSNQDVTWSSDGSLYQTQFAADPDLVAKIIAASPVVVDGSVVFTITPAVFTSTGVMWWGAQAWINYLNSIEYQGVQNWRMSPSQEELASLRSQLGGVSLVTLEDNHNDNYDLFHNIQGIYWTAQDAPFSEWIAHWYDLGGGSEQVGGPKDYFWNVMAVRDGVVAVAEPATYALILVGLASISLVRSRKPKQP